MRFRSIDVVAAGPPSADPYDPSAPAWALAAAFARRGSCVRVLHPGGGGKTPAVQPDVISVPLDLKGRHPGAAVEPAELAAAAGRRLEDGVDLVVRDPSGLGRLGIARKPNGPPTILGLVRGGELSLFDRERSSRAPVGVVDRIDTWRDRRSVRRLERLALEEADRLFYDQIELARALAKEYAIPERRLRPAPPAVAVPAERPTRAEARTRLKLPLDVPVVVAQAAVDRPEAAGVDRAREAFRRVRSLFAGARLVVVGAPAPVEPGVQSVSERDIGAFVNAMAAGDVAIFTGRAPGFDPGVALAQAIGCATMVLPGVTFPSPPVNATRVAPSDDPGDAASLLAELLADPALRRELVKAGSEYAAQFVPDHVADVLEAEASRWSG
jgi:glycosyltransferase involved in cell wall biosynthesis